MCPSFSSSVITGMSGCRSEAYYCKCGHRLQWMFFFIREFLIIEHYGSFLSSLFYLNSQWYSQLRHSKKQTNCWHSHNGISCRSESRCINQNYQTHWPLVSWTIPASYRATEMWNHSYSVYLGRHSCHCKLSATNLDTWPFEKEKTPMEADTVQSILFVCFHIKKKPKCFHAIYS